MKNEEVILILIAVLTASIASAQEIGVDQLKQKMETSAGNLTTYTYSRYAQSDLRYSNSTITTEFDANKETEGKVDLIGRSGWWSSNLTDEGTHQVLRWQGYFVNGSEYWKEGMNWTRFTSNDTARIMQDYNELPGEVELLKYSDMKIVGSERLEGVDTYKLVGSPVRSVYEGMIGLQLFAAYFPAPFQLPSKLKNRTLDISNTSIMNNSRVVLTAWVSKDKSLLRRLNINSTLTITPEILNISSPDFRIDSKTNETTVYSNFGSPVNIELPEDINESYRHIGMDWRWAVFGSVRP